MQAPPIEASPYLSIVVPCYNEAESLPELYREIAATVAAMGRSFELLFIDDGSTDNSPDVIWALHAKDNRVRCIQFRRNAGKSEALSAGFREARGAIVVTMDADLQDDPGELPNLLATLDAGYDVVSGWKYPRRDPLSKRLPSAVINWLTSRLTGVRIHDMNCGLKAYRREAVEHLTLYGEQYRFIPALVSDQGFKVGERKVNHRPRAHGASKYGARRLFTGFFDLITVVFLTRFVRKPLHIFGLLGVFHLSIGAGIVGYTLYLRIMHGSILSRHPLLVGGVMLVIMGIQLICTGLIAEMIARYGERATANRSPIKCKF